MLDIVLPAPHEWCVENQVMVHHPEGWTVSLLQDWRELASAAIRVDGGDLRENGRFRLVVLTFPSPALAASFAVFAEHYVSDGAEVVRQDGAQILPFNRET